MGVNAEFRRDMQQNLFVLRDQEISVSMFQEKMIEHNQLEGFLPIRVQRMNGERILFYDLYGTQPLSEVCHVTLPNVMQLTSMVQGILQAIRKVGEYLLKEDDILLSLEYMFVRLPEYQVKLCYYPGYQNSIKKQISQLFEVLMSCVDYEDRDAVYLMYSLYMKSKDESCTVLELEQLLNREARLESGLQEKARIDHDAKERVNAFLDPKDEQQTLVNPPSSINSQMLSHPQGKSKVQSSAQAQTQTNLSTQSQTQTNSFMQSQPQVYASQQPQPQIYPATLSQAQVYSPIRSQQKEDSSTQSKMQLNSSKKSQQQLSSIPPKNHCANQDIPLAMSTSVMPPELGFGQKMIPGKSIDKQLGATKANVFRPLISNDREEEKEVWFYPSRCYLLGGLIAISAVLVFGVIIKSNILLDPVLRKLEPIKLIAALCIVALPAFYGVKVVFNPDRKVSKYVAAGEYEVKEIAATKEAMECEVPKFKTSSYPSPESSSRLVKVSSPGLIDQGDNTMGRKEVKQREETSQTVNIGLQNISTCEEETRFNTEMLSLPEEQKSISDNRTVLLNGVQASPFAQLISEHPEKAGTITLVECPFYIGTVKNQMNYSLSCPVISRYHAKIEKLNGIYYISDLNSTNGTFVNGRRLKAEEPNVLIAGDKVAFANICFIFACPNQKYEI